MKPSPLFYVIGFGMILVGLIAVFLSLSYGSEWFFIFLGFLAWIVSVGLKFAWALPTNKKITIYFKNKLPSKFSGITTWTYLGSLTGVFECGISLLFVLFIPSLFNANWQNIIGFGVGFGAIESLLLGIFSLISNLYFLIKPTEAPKEVKKLWQTYKKHMFTAISIPIIERTFTLLIHIFTKTLIILAVQQNFYLFWVSFFFKSLVDSIAAWSHFELKITNWKKPKQIWQIELIIIILGVISAIGIFWLSK